MAGANPLVVPMVCGYYGGERGRPMPEVEVPKTEMPEVFRVAMKLLATVRESTLCTAEQEAALDIAARIRRYQP
jgi:hypothetical protein